MHSEAYYVIVHPLDAARARMPRKLSMGCQQALEIEGASERNQARW